MLSSSLKYSRLLLLFNFIQVGTLLVYLNANIINVGGQGTALPLLAAYLAFSILSFVLIWMQKPLFLRPHLFLFLLLVIWVSFRVVTDLDSLNYLKQITIATTGGMLLFYFMGALLGVSYQAIVMKGRAWMMRLVILISLCLLLWMMSNFSPRIRDDIFYLKGVDGGYQRPGNFLSISFVVTSFFFFLHSFRYIGVKKSRFSYLFWIFTYTVSTFIALVGSQLFGSNSATAIILGVYLITVVMTLVIPSKVLWLNYAKHALALPWSKKLILRLAFIALSGFMAFSLLLTLVISLTNFDITSLRLLGFGSGTNTSLLTRIEILLETGIDQIGYAPFFGNINVAYLITGDAGRTLHSFFPYVMANLGLIGLLIVLALFLSIFLQLYREIKIRKPETFFSYQESMVALYSFFILLFLISFASLATGVSWAVLWFSLGFICKPFGFKDLNEKCTY